MLVSNDIVVNLDSRDKNHDRHHPIKGCIGEYAMELR